MTDRGFSMTVPASKQPIPPPSTPNKPTLLQQIRDVYFGRENRGDDLAYFRLLILLSFGIAGTLGLVIAWFAAENHAVALMWALSCFIGGGAVGFLFGIPKTSQSGGPSHAAPGGTVPASAASNPNTAPTRGYQQYVNTNLEDISDWLTKIIVGITLIEFREILSYFHTVAEMCGKGLGGDDPGKSLSAAKAIIGYFSALGTLHGYLYTRLILAGAFRLADEFALDRIEQQVKAVGEKVDRMEARVLDAESKAEVRAETEIKTLGKSLPPTPKADKPVG